jgi:hypothetical protein
VSLARRTFNQCASVFFSCKMVSRPTSFLHGINLRLVQKPKKKSRLGSYFAAHREFQEVYREPSSSPETPTSSGFPSATRQSYNKKRLLSLAHESPGTATTKTAKRRARGDVLRKPSYKGPDRLFTDNINSRSMTYMSLTVKGVSTHFGAESSQRNRLSTGTPRDQNCDGLSTTMQSQSELYTTGNTHIGNTGYATLSAHIESSYYRGGHCLRNTTAREKRTVGESLYIFRHRGTGPSDHSTC